MIRLFAVVALALVTSGLAAAETNRTDAATTDRAYRCSNISGSSMTAPAWKTERDGAAGQHVLVNFKGAGELADVKWMNGGTAYYGATGVGTAMRTGFSIAVVAAEFAEMYVFDAATNELFYAQIRSGSALLPNLMKSFKASCEPARAAVG